MSKTLLALSVQVLISISVSAQSKLNFDSLVAANAVTFKGGSQFSGKGWDHLIEKSKRTNYILIGEDHFISEVPLFTQAFAQQVKFDNYICEMDKWMMDIFTSKITRSTPAQLDAWITANYNNFSFFQKKNEFELMKSLINQKTKLFGIEQVGLVSTTTIYQYLYETGSAKNKKLYEAMRDSSAVVNEKFYKDFNNPFYMITPHFTETMKKVSSPTPAEAELLEALNRSAGIYQTGSHQARIKLMQQNLAGFYPQLKGKKNLFKFGANHTLKGESYIPVYDIGTTAHIYAQAENQDSYHILVVPKSGKQAGFISGSNDIDYSDGFFAALKPFFDKSSSTEWTTIDLEKVRAAVRKSKYEIRDDMLRKTLLGYDAIVVIPVATAAESVR
ncbi:MAG TPA: hypothetical protein VFE50_20420 [Cyclobacteriaceae bacterium]|nr:hypothetical protein [Cyclobacteriaceae bacterium]